MSRRDGTARDEIDQLRHERDEAWAHARAMEHELGAARGRIKRLELVLYRRTQHRRYLAAWAARLRGAVERIRRLGAEPVGEATNRDGRLHRLRSSRSSSRAAATVDLPRRSR